MGSYVDHLYFTSWAKRQEIHVNEAIQLCIDHDVPVYILIPSDWDIAYYTTIVKQGCLEKRFNEVKDKVMQKMYKEGMHGDIINFSSFTEINENEERIQRLLGESLIELREKEVVPITFTYPLNGETGRKIINKDLSLLGITVEDLFFLSKDVSIFENKFKKRRVLNGFAEKGSNENIKILKHSKPNVRASDHNKRRISKQHWNSIKGKAESKAKGRPGHFSGSQLAILVCGEEEFKELQLKPDTVRKELSKTPSIKQFLK